MSRKKYSVGHQICTKCEIDKPMHEFYRDSSRIDGHLAQCKKCIQSIKRNYTRKNKTKEFVAQFKSKPCTDCGKSYPDYVMDFDHVYGTKTANIALLVQNRAAKVRLIREIEKCELVCSNCHRHRTYLRYQKPLHIVMNNIVEDFKNGH